MTPIVWADVNLEPGGRVFRVHPAAYRELERGFLKAGNAVREASRRGRVRTARRVERTAKRKAPVQHGTLRGSIHVEEDGGPRVSFLASLSLASALDEVAVVVPEDVPYGRRREFENLKNPDRVGYMRKAVAEHTNDLADDVGAEIRKVT